MATGLPATPTRPRAHDAPSGDQAPAAGDDVAHGPTDHAADGDGAMRGEGTTRDARRVDTDRHATPEAGVAQRTARPGKPSRDTRGDDDAPHDDAFARLLDPVAAEAAKPTTALQAAAPQQAAAQDPHARPAALPDQLPGQLLGLLASLAPGASPASSPAVTPTAADGAGNSASSAQANALPAATAAMQAGTPPAAAAGAQVAASIAGDPPPASGSGTLDTPSSALQTGKDAGAPVATMHAEQPTASAPATHVDGNANTPAASFDALLHASTSVPAATPVDNARTVAAAPTPLAQPADPRNGYGDELGGNLVWMAEQRLGHARLHVAPEHLGPIEVRLQLDGSQVQASFLSAQPDVRHALEASLPRLRELLGQHGLQLAQADVGQRQQDPRGLPTQRRKADGRESTHGDGLASPVLPHARVVARGLLDEYA